VFSSETHTDGKDANPLDPQSGGVQEACDAYVHGLSRAMWRKSSLSAHNGNCVEVAQLTHRAYGVRDSKNVDGPILIFDQVAWSAFLEDVREGRFNLV
jgi:Domain of unknown function (DUF397)